MRATRTRMIILTTGAVLFGLSRLGGLSADISVIALDPALLAPNVAEQALGEGTQKFHGAPSRPLIRTM